MVNISLATPVLPVDRRLGIRLRVVIALVVTFGLGRVGVARGDVNASSAAADTVLKRTFAIPAQPLPTALVEFGRQAGIEVTGEPSIRGGASVARDLGQVHSR